MQFLLDVTQALLEDVSVARADSCATADHPMIDHIWRERLVLSDQLISPAGSAFVCACSLSLPRALVATAKVVRHLGVDSPEHYVHSSQEKAADGTGSDAGTQAPGAFAIFAAAWATAMQAYQPACPVLSSVE